MSDEELNNALQRSIALRAYQLGFHEAADPSGARKRHAVDPETHYHWRRGFDDGKRAALAARDLYAADLKNGPRPHSQAWHTALTTGAPATVRASMSFVYLQDCGHSIVEAYNCTCGTTLGLDGIGPCQWIGRR